ncbi:MAG: MFS transporter, partial [Rhodobacteraceae bacterium]|nr:MFS transporter [Paracoccaceae bacterium]
PAPAPVPGDSPRGEATHAPAVPSSGPGDRWRLVLLAFAFATVAFTASAMAAHLPALLQEAGATPAAAIAAAALVGPAQVAGRLMEFGLMHRIGPLTAARAAMLAHPLGAGVLLVTGPGAAVVFCGLHGAGNGVLTIARGTVPLALFGPAGYGLRQGWLAAPGMLAQAGAPFAFALLVAAAGTGALWLTVALALVGAGAMMVLAPTRAR